MRLHNADMLGQGKREESGRSSLLSVLGIECRQLVREGRKTRSTIS